MKGNLNAASIGIVIACVFFVVAVFLLNRAEKKHEALVQQDSKKLPLIHELNTKYRFYSILPIVQLHKVCKSKHEFDRANLKDFLVSQISDNREYFFDLITKANINKNDYQNYKSEFSAIVNSLPDDKNYSTHSYFRPVEERLIAKEKQNPIVDPTIRVTKIYTSPMGRNSYHSSADFKGAAIIECYNLSRQQELNRQSTKNQRVLMTDSLRYDVMKRDGFRCVICGATAKDGVKLHVDHIFPVAKGGKTELSNLRTLCEHCNRGKSAKFDPNGPN